MPGFLAALHKLHEAHASGLLHPYGRFVRILIRIIGV
jgi:hypothetical protein